MPRFSLHCALALVLLAASYGCASSAPGTIESLDSHTGVTILRSRSPVVFYRDTPVRAAYARDFVSLGPLSVNRMGEHHYYLWLGVWGTMADWSGPDTRDNLESAVLFVDGEPIMLELAGWTPASIELSENVYGKPAAAAIEAYFEITLDQIRRLSEASSLTLLTGDGDPSYYEPWDDPGTVRAMLRTFYSDDHR